MLASCDARGAVTGRLQHAVCFDFAALRLDAPGIGGDQCSTLLICSKVPVLLKCSACTLAQPPSS